MYGTLTWAAVHHRQAVPFPDALDRWSQDQGLAMETPRPWNPSPVSRPPAYPRQPASSSQDHHLSREHAFRAGIGQAVWTPHRGEEAQSRDDHHPRDSHAAAAGFHPQVPQAEVPRQAIGLPPTDPSRHHAQAQSRSVNFQAYRLAHVQQLPRQ